MKKSLVILPLIVLLLAGCRKTDEAFPENKYNSSIFENNYYWEWNGINYLQIGNDTTFEPSHPMDRTIPNLPGEVKDLDYGFEVKNLIKEEDRFSYGYLSKLYDGRLSCGGYTTRSRVQLNKTGYATYFPREYRGSSGIAFALRGATTLSNSPGKKMKIDATFRFYVRREGTDIYDRVNLVYKDLEIETDNHGQSTYVDSIFDQEEFDALYGADAMSFEYQMKETPAYSAFDLTDDYFDKTKEHFAVMMYEVLLPDSKWY